MFDVGQNFASDYHRTKFESEQLVRETSRCRGASTDRPWCLGDSETGEIDKIDGPYYFFSLIKRMRDYLPGCLPSVPAPGFTMTNVVPVDYVAKAMDALAHKPGLDNRAFHLVNPTPQRNLDILELFCRSGEVAAPQGGARRQDRRLPAHPRHPGGAGQGHVHRPG